MSRPRCLGGCLLVFALLVPAGFLPGQKSAGEEKKLEKKPKDTGKVITRLKVLVPEDAKIQIDGLLTKSTGKERLFTTPEIDKDKTYSYTFKWTYADGGNEVTRMALIQFVGGKEKIIDLRPGSKEVLSSQIIYVPTAQNIVDKMLELAKIKKDDVVYDLGCGDGRILVTAAKKFGAKGVGIDIDPERIKDSRDNIKKNKVEKLIEIRQGDALRVADISRATVVTLYMLPEFQEKLAPILKKKLKPGTRVVAHDYWLPGWTEELSVQVDGPFRKHTLYLYRVEGKKE